MSEQPAGDEFSVPLAWIGVEEMPVQPVNNFLLQLDTDAQGVLFVAGMASPPAVIGTPEEQMAAIRDLTFVAARPAARLFMTRARFEELRSVMNQVSEMWDAAAPR